MSSSVSGLRAVTRSEPRKGEDENGDLALVRSHDARTLVVVVDGLGHGPRAREAAAAAEVYLREAPVPTTPDPLVGALHDALRGTRGAAMTVCLFEGVTVRGWGVGNVELRAARSEVPFVNGRGIVGVRYSRPRVFEADLVPGERVCLFTDGVSRRMSLSSVTDLSLEEARDALFERHAGGHDDATLVLCEVSA